jgi:hypothetical protein
MQRNDMTKDKSSLTLVISYLNLRIAVGVLGVAFPILLVVGDAVLGGDGFCRSISYYYHTAMRDLFVGVLFIIASMLFAYRGYSDENCPIDNVISTLGCFFAIGIAVCPSIADRNQTDISTSAIVLDTMHFISAVLFFLTLIYFCLFLFIKTDKAKMQKPKICRNRVYRISGYTMLGSMLFLALYYVALRKWFPEIEGAKPVFCLESLMLWAFGWSWLTKGQAILKDHKEDED